MGRMITVSRAMTAVTVAQDILAVKAGTARGFRLHYVSVFQNTEFTDAEAEMIDVTIMKGVGDTPGSGGSALTIGKHNDSDAADAFAIELGGNTTLATGGTISTLWPDSFHVAAGWYWLPPPSMILEFAISETFLLRLGAPDDSTAFGAMAVIEELG